MEVWLRPGQEDTPVQPVQVVPMVGAEEAKCLLDKDQQGSRSTTLKHPSQVHGRLKVLWLPQLDVDLDVLR
jgi:hypothetical protein